MKLTRFAVGETIRRIRAAGDLHWPDGKDEAGLIDEWATQLATEHGGERVWSVCCDKYGFPPQMLSSGELLDLQIALMS